MALFRNKSINDCRSSSFAIYKPIIAINIISKSLEILCLFAFSENKSGYHLAFWWSLGVTDNRQKAKRLSDADMV